MRNSYSTQATKKALEKEVKQRRKAEWLEKNADAVRACNELTENHGQFSDSHRVF